MFSKTEKNSVSPLVFVDRIRYILSEYSAIKNPAVRMLFKDFVERLTVTLSLITNKLTQEKEGFILNDLDDYKKVFTVLEALQTEKNTLNPDETLEFQSLLAIFNKMLRYHSIDEHDLRELIRQQFLQDTLKEITAYVGHKKRNCFVLSFSKKLQGFEPVVRDLKHIGIHMQLGVWPNDFKSDVTDHILIPTDGMSKQSCLLIERQIKQDNYALPVSFISNQDFTNQYGQSLLHLISTLIPNSSELELITNHFIKKCEALTRMNTSELITIYQQNRIEFIGGMGNENLQYLSKINSRTEPFYPFHIKCDALGTTMEKVKELLVPIFQKNSAEYLQLIEKQVHEAIESGPSYLKLSPSNQEEVLVQQEMINDYKSQVIHWQKRIKEKNVLPGSPYHKMVLRNSEDVDDGIKTLKTMLESDALLDDFLKQNFNTDLMDLHTAQTFVKHQDLTLRVWTKNSLTDKMTLIEKFSHLAPQSTKAIDILCSTDGTSYEVLLQEPSLSEPKSTFNLISSPQVLLGDDFQTAMEKRVFVDKTDFIKEIIDNHTPVIQITRPDGFGKSTNLSMLKSFYEKTSQDTSYLFKELNIWSYGSTYHEKQGKYPVIFLNLGDLKTAKTYDDAFKIYWGIIAKLYNQFKYVLNGDTLGHYQKEDYHKILNNQKMEGGEAGYALRSLMQYLQKFHGKRVVVLIDDCDSYLYPQLPIEDLNRLENTIEHSLLMVLKDNESLEKAVLMGVIPVYPANNIRNYTVFDNRYSSHFGFSKKETQNLLHRFSLVRYTDDLLDQYGGYHFGTLPSKPMCNVRDVVQFITENCGRSIVEFKPNQSKPSILLPQKIIKLLESNLYSLQDIRKHPIEGKIFWEGIDLNDPRQNDMLNLLLYSGYLTVKSHDDEAMKYEFTIPNQSMVSYCDYLIKNPGNIGRITFFNPKIVPKEHEIISAHSNSYK